MISLINASYHFANFAYSILPQGAIGKCTSLFNYFDDTLKKCEDSSSAVSLAITNEVQSELESAHHLSDS